MANNVSKIFNSSFTKNLSNKIDDALSTSIKNLRKNPNFKSLDKGTKNRIITMKMPEKVQSEVVDKIGNGASKFKNKFGTKFVKASPYLDNTYEDLGFKIGKNRENIASERILKENSKSIKEVDDWIDEIANIRQNRNVNNHVSITDETIKKKQQEIIKQKNTENHFYNKEKLNKRLEQRLSHIKNIENGTVGMPIRNLSNSENSTINKNITASVNKNNNSVANPNNWVYKLAAAGVGGGMVLSMSNNKGQQTNSQLYGQGGY